MGNGKQRSRHMPPLVRDIRNRGYPSCSWWTACATREAFNRAAAAQRLRMSWSDFGRTWKSRDLA